MEWVGVIIEEYLEGAGEGNRGIQHLAQFIARRVKPGPAARCYCMNEAVHQGYRRDISGGKTAEW